MSQTYNLSFTSVPSSHPKDLNYTLNLQRHSLRSKMPNFHPYFPRPRYTSTTSSESNTPQTSTPSSPKIDAQDGAVEKQVEKK
jgi:hypothetical protein